MKSSTTGCRNGLLLMLLLGMVLARDQGAAMMIPLDGHASVRILLASEDTVLFATRTSGSELERVIALEAGTGAVRWRALAGRVGGATFLPPDAFYLVSKDHLEKRWLRNGGVYWSNRLDTIPAQKTAPRVKIRERMEQALAKLGLVSKTTRVQGFMRWSGTPSYYSYQNPVPVGSAVFVHRTGMSGGGCVVQRCFEDWLLFDARTGARTGGGSGAFLGQTEGMALVGDAAGLFRVAKGKATEVLDAEAVADLNFASPLWADLAPLSSRDRCTFLLDRFSGSDGMGVFEARSGEVRTFPLPATRGDYQTAWVLLDGQLLRYPQCLRYTDSGAPRQGPAWFELYDLDGRCLKSVEAGPAINPSAWWLGFVERTTNAVLFRNGDQTLRVAVPSLQIQQMPSEPRPGPNGAETGPDSTRLSPGGRSRYAATGNTQFPTMATATVPHDAVVTARDVATGKVLWRHVERLTVVRVR